jgi:hypothetical protein
MKDFAATKSSLILVESDQGIYSSCANFESKAYGLNCPFSMVWSRRGIHLSCNVRMHMGMTILGGIKRICRSQGSYFPSKLMGYGYG